MQLVYNVVQSNYLWDWEWDEPIPNGLHLQITILSIVFIPKLRPFRAWEAAQVAGKTHRQRSRQRLFSELLKIELHTCFESAAVKSQPDGEQSTTECSTTASRIHDESASLPEGVPLAAVFCLPHDGQCFSRSHRDMVNLSDGHRVTWSRRFVDDPW